MWELICDHRYCWATIAADRSGWHSDGHSFGVQPLTDHIGLHFPGPQSRIVVPRTEPWLSLTGIRIELTLRISSYAPGDQYLIAGDGSFGMYMEHAVLGGYCGDDATRESLNTTSDLVSQFTPVPVGRWVRLTFEHNGFNAMALLIDDALAARRPVINPIPGVGTQGVVVGNGIGTTQGYMRGDIESVKVWRIDPRSIDNEFLARPLDRGLSDCWTEFMCKVDEALRSDPDCAEWLKGVVSQILQKVFQALAQMSVAKIEEFRKMCDEYRALWRAGHVGSPAMLALLARLRDWLKAEGLLALDDPALRKTLQNPCLTALAARLPSLDCEVQAMLRAIIGQS